MAMHDDSGLQLLERDLTALATARDADERLRRALRDELLATLRQPPPTRRRLSMRSVAGATALLATAAAVAVFALVRSAGSGGPAIASAAIVHRALRAVTPPPNQILHTKVVGVQNGATVRAESWQETSPPYASRVLKGVAGHQGEFADNGTMSLEYDPATDSIAERPESALPPFADPVSQVRQELADGRARVTGTVTIAGAALYKIDLPQGLVGYFAENDYRPRYLDDPQRDGSIVRLEVIAYDYLPMTATNRDLLSVVAQHPRAHIVTGAVQGSGK